MLNQKRPNPIDAEQIKRKEDDRNQGNNCRVLHFVSRRPRDTTHLCARIADKLAQSRKKSRRSRTLFSAANATAGCRLAAADLPWRLTIRTFWGARCIEFFFAHANLV